MPHYFLDLSRMQSPERACGQMNCLKITTMFAVSRWLSGGVLELFFLFCLLLPILMKFHLLLRRQYLL